MYLRYVRVVLFVSTGPSIPPMKNAGAGPFYLLLNLSQERVCSVEHSCVDQPKADREAVDRKWSNGSLYFLWLLEVFSNGSVLK